MLTAQRQQIIQQRLGDMGEVSAKDLAVQFDLSEDTIRRDLRTLAKTGVCRRVYGGAVATPTEPMAVRKTENTKAKDALGRAAGQLLHGGQTVYLDAGSTNFAIARHLPPHQPLTVVTNALDIAQEVARHPQIKLLILGGTFNVETGACTGPMALAAIRSIAADIVFLGACGLDALTGVTAFDPYEAGVKHAMVQSSARVVVATTPDKLGTTAPYRVTGPTKIDDIITTAGQDAEHDVYRKRGIRMTYAALS